MSLKKAHNVLTSAIETETNTGTNPTPIKMTWLHGTEKPRWILCGSPQPARFWITSCLISHSLGQAVKPLCSPRAILILADFEQFAASVNLPSGILVKLVGIKPSSGFGIRVQHTQKASTLTRLEPSSLFSPFLDHLYTAIIKLEVY